MQRLPRQQGGCIATKSEREMISLKPENASEKVVIDMTDERMTGLEEYGIVGQCLTTAELTLLIRECEGLHMTADCVKKAEIVIGMRKELPSLHRIGPMVLCVGAVRIYAIDMRSAYGHDFNPPYECHAWARSIADPRILVDLALPGLIIRGSRLEDEQGPFLYGREPVVLAGLPAKWMSYQAGETWIGGEKCQR